MSGHSSSTTCPNCGKDADLYTDWKPFDYCSIRCLYCGLNINPVIEYQDLEALNDDRVECGDLEPLTELPEQTFKW